MQKYSEIAPSIENVLNLSKTIDSLLGNIFNLIEESRSQIFEVLENIAFYEAQSDIEKFNAKSKKSKINQKAAKKPDAGMPERTLSGGQSGG